QIARSLGWRVVFLGMIPLVGVAAGLAMPALARLGPPSAQPAGEHRLSDAALTAVGAGLLIGAPAASSPLLAALLVLAGLAVGLPALRRLLPAGTLSARQGLPATILSRGLLTYTFFGADAFITLAITTVRHHSITVASVVITSSTLTWTAGAWVQARLNRSREGRPAPVTSACALAGAAALAARFVTRRLPLSLAISPAGPAVDRVIR